MLQSIRERAQGWLAGVIITLICIPFALWGIQQYVGGGGSVVVAEINGEEIGVGAYRQAYQNYRQQIERLIGKSVDVDQLNQERIKLDALNQLVDSEVLRQAAQKSGMRISNRQLAETIQAFPAFQVDNKFSNARYEQGLRNLGMSATGFEQQLRRDLLNEQLRQGLLNSSFVTESERKTAAKLRYQTRTVQYATISADPIKESLQISDEDVEAYYNENIASYTTPEMVKIRYLEVSLGDLAKEVPVDDETVAAEYQARLDSFKVPEERYAHHILIAVDKVATESEEADARKRAEDLLERLRGGEDFEELAKQFSEDLASKHEGGATGRIRRGEMEPQFEAAIFDMQPGEMKLVQTSFGFHIVRLDEVKPERTKQLDDVREEVRAEIQTERAHDLLYERVDQLANLAFENPDALDAAAEALGLDIATAGPFSRQGSSAVDEKVQAFLDSLDVGEDTQASVEAKDEISSNPKVLAAAFSPQVLEERQNSDVIEIGPDRFVVLRVQEHLPAAPRPLQDVKEDVSEALRLARATEQARVQGESVLEELRSGQALQQVADAHGLRWERVESVGRTGTELSRIVSRKVFSMVPPSSDQATFDGVTAGGGDFVLIALESVHEGDPDAVDDEQKSGNDERLANNSSRWEWLDFVAEVKQGADIEVFTDNL
jgi:peptidyl-prolyl cis-trans isomerase D